MEQINNYYIDRRTFVNIDQRPQVAQRTPAQLAAYCDHLTETLQAYATQSHKDTAEIARLLLENKVLRDEVARLRALLPPEPTDHQTETNHEN